MPPTHTPTQILMERAGDLVVHVKFTVLLLPSGTSKVTGLPFPTDAIDSDKVSQSRERCRQSGQASRPRRAEGGLTTRVPMNEQTNPQELPEDIKAILATSSKNKKKKNKKKNTESA